MAQNPFYCVCLHIFRIVLYLQRFIQRLPKVYECPKIEIQIEKKLNLHVK